jgi:hypothetical protein
MLVALLATSCATSRHAREAKFHEEDRADLIVRYYTDDTSYVLKPQSREGLFLAVLNKDAVVDVARQQEKRDLAVVVLIHYCTENQTAEVKQRWSSLLTDAGYQRVIFLRGRTGMDVNGLAVLGNGG